jgi:hypothetical protein
MRYNKRNYFNYIVVEIHAEILTLTYKHEIRTHYMYQIIFIFNYLGLAGL